MFNKNSISIKKVVLLFLFAFSPFLIYSQFTFRYSKYIDGMWGNWEATSYSYNTIQENYFLFTTSREVPGEVGKCYLQGGYDDLFITHGTNSHPSDYSIRIKIDNFKIEEDRKERKRRIKSEEWYVYEGTIYIRGKENAKDALKNFPDNIFDMYLKQKHETKYRAKIKIAPYKKRPLVYNIMFEDVGLAIMMPE